MKQAYNIIFTIFLLAFSCCALADEKMNSRDDVKDFINYMSEKHKFTKEELTSIFSNISSSEDVIKNITRPAEKFSWSRYKKIFLTKERVSKGVDFWLENKSLLEKANEKYQIPPEIIVSIIGVETFYGERKGGYPVIQALSTLAFDYPKRSKFFRKELENFLLLSRENNLDTLNLEGSYAGAIGIAQFMPSSYRAYAKNFEDTGNVDLISNKAHAIASVANYLKAFGWKPGQSVIHKAHTNTKSYSNVVAQGSNPVPEHTLDMLSKYQVFPKEKLNNIKDKFALIEFEDENKNELYLARNNFYVITRYNHSSNYALAVYELAQMIKEEFKKANP